MLTFVECVKERVHRGTCFWLLDIPAKFEINANVDEIKLILNGSHSRIFDGAEYFLRKFTRLTTSKGVTHNILFSNQVDSYFFRGLLESSHQKSSPFVNVLTESGDSFLSG